MSRPEFVTQEDIDRWSSHIDSDPLLPNEIRQQPLLREVLYAGEWLIEKLEQTDCSTINRLRIVYTAGQLSFGHDPWEIHQEMWDAYTNNQIEFEIDYDA